MKKSLPLLLVGGPAVLALGGFAAFVYQAAGWLREIHEGSFGRIAWSEGAAAYLEIAGLFFAPAVISILAYRRWKPEPRVVSRAAIWITCLWAIVPLATISALTKVSPSSQGRLGMDPHAVLALMKAFRSGPADFPAGFRNYSTSFLPVSQKNDADWMGRRLALQIAAAAPQKQDFLEIVIGGPEAGDLNPVLATAFALLGGRFPNIRLVLVGAARVDQAQRRAASRLDLDLRELPAQP